MQGSFTVTNHSLTPFRTKAAGDNKQVFEMGQIITATITKQTDAITSLSTADGFRFDAATDAIEGNPGDELRFEVVSAGRNKLRLKQIKQASNEAVKNMETRRSSAGLKDMLRQSGMYLEPEYKSDDRELQLKAMEAASKIKRKLRYVTNNAGRSAMKELLASGVSLEKISIDILNSVMHEIEARPESTTSPDELDALINKYMAENNIPAEDTGRRELVVRALAEQGLPATSRNVRAIDTVLVKALEIMEPDDDCIAKLLKDDKSLTVENIYLAKHTASKLPPGDALTSEKWALLKPEAERIFEREGIEWNEQTEAAAKLLVEREIPLTADNIDKITFLRGLKDSMDMHKILYQAAGRIKQDRLPADVSVYADSLQAVYESVTADIPFITSAHMEYLLNREPEPTVADCCRVLSERVPETNAASKAYERLLEIRRKLTYDAARQLISKNIDISKMKLDEALSKLDSLSVDYSKNLRAMGAHAGEENVSQMRELYTCIDGLSPLPSRVFAELLGRSIPFTIRAVHGAASAERLQAGYEQHETAPARGERVDHRRIESFLESIEVQATRNNIRAAEILTKTRTSINPENITQIKLIDMKLSDIQNRLHPNIAASMIKEGLNPLNMHVDEVLSYIDGFNDEYGEGIADKIAEHIRALDAEKTLTQEERGAMVAIYRTLNLVRKDNSACLGLSLRHGDNLTLGKLLSDSQIRQMLSSPENMNRRQDNNIRQLLDDVSAKTLTESELNSMMMEKLAERATPAALRSALAEYDLPLEETLELMPEADYDPEARIERMRTALNAAGELPAAALARMQYAGAPDTVANLHAMNAIENAGLGKMLRELEGHLKDEELEELDELEGSEKLDLPEIADFESVETALEALSRQLDDIKDRLTSSSLLNELILTQNAVKVQSFLGRNEYRMPVRLSSGISDLSMIILDENVSKRDTADVLLALDTPGLGKVQVFIRRSGTEARFEISADNPRSMEALRQNAGALREYVSKAGFEAELVFKEQAEDIRPAERTAFSDFEFSV